MSDNNKGVFIKGYSLPRNCGECACFCGGWCAVSPSDVDEPVAETVDELFKKGGKPEWCPMVEMDGGAENA